MLLLSVAYFLPALNLRKYAWLKLLTLVFVWTITTAVVPIWLNNELLFSSKNLLQIFSRLFFMLAVCIPFDIRDLNIDAHEKTSTVPQIVGETTARYLSLGFMLCHIILVIAPYIGAFASLKIFVALLISSLINTLFLVQVHSKRSEYFYVAGIDGTLIIQGLILMIAEYLF